MESKLYIVYEHWGYGMCVMFVSTSVEDAIKLILESRDSALYDLDHENDEIRLRFYTMFKGEYKKYSSSDIVIKPIELSQYIGIEAEG